MRGRFYSRIAVFPVVEGDVTMSKEEHAVPVVSRRTWCMGAASVAALFGLGALRFAPEMTLVRPPGGLDEDNLVSKCIHCSKCVESCPRRVIALSHLEDGVLALRTPYMRFNEDYCDGCAQANGGVPLCVKNCPTGALQNVQMDMTGQVFIGVARIDDTCLARREAMCRWCYDACPYEAMGLDSIGRPFVIEDLCNGCGACEAACVSLTAGSKVPGATKRAITVQTYEGR